MSQLNWFTSESSEEVSPAFARTFLREFLNSPYAETLTTDASDKLRLIAASLSVPELVGCSDANPASLFHLQTLTCRVPVAASSFSSVSSSVTSRLSSILLAKRSPELRGILLAFSRCAIPETSRVMWDQRTIVVVLRLRALVFGPAPGTLIRGRVSKMNPDHVSLLVLQVFNASVPRAGIEEVLSKEVRVGDVVDFTVDRIDSATTPIFIRGVVAESSKKRPAEEEKGEGEEPRTSKRPKKAQESQKMVQVGDH